MTTPIKTESFPAASADLIAATVERVHRARLEHAITIDEVAIRWELSVEDLWLKGYGGRDMAVAVLHQCIARFGVGQELLTDEVAIDIVALSRAVAVRWMKDSQDSYFVVQVPGDGR